MAVTVSNNAFLSIGGHDISSWCKSVKLTVDGESHDVTVMGNSGWRSTIVGLKTWSIDAELVTEYGATKSGDLAWDHFATEVAVIFRPDSGTKSATNPEYTGNATMFSFGDGGSVGEVPPIGLKLSGVGALARAVA